MSSTQQFKAGQACGTGEAKAEQWMDSATDAASMASQSAQENTEKASGFLQQTGEQLMGKAQGAVDTVKNTLGMGDNSSSNPSSNTPSGK